MQYGKYFLRSFSYFARFFTSHKTNSEIRGKYLPILYKATRKNNFTIKSVLQTKYSKSFLVQCNTNLVQTNRRDKKLQTLYLYFQTFDNFVFPYLSSNVLYFIFIFVFCFRIFCIHSSVWYFQIFNDFWKHVST